MDMYKRAVVMYDSQHRQMAVCGMRAPTDEEAVYKAHQTGMAGKAILIAEVVRSRFCPISQGQDCSESCEEC
jgi:hypothetical protein